MQRLVIGVFVLVVGVVTAADQDSQTPVVREKSGLKVLYVGPSPVEPSPVPAYISGELGERYVQLKLERFDAFEKLLTEHFENVTMLVAADYKIEMSADHDVTIFDELPPVLETVKVKGWEKQIRLPDDFDAPAFMIGEVAPLAIGRFGNDFLLDHL